VSEQKTLKDTTSPLSAREFGRNKIYAREKDGKKTLRGESVTDKSKRTNGKDWRELNSRDNDKGKKARRSLAAF